jgi:hypothetical protein
LSIRYTGESLPGVTSPTEPAPQPATAPPTPTVAAEDVATNVFANGAPGDSYDSNTSSAPDGTLVQANPYFPQQNQAQLGQLPRVNAGSVTVSQNSLVFQIGANAEQTTSLALRNMRADSLGTQRLM